MVPRTIRHKITSVLAFERPFCNQILSNAFGNLALLQYQVLCWWECYENVDWGCCPFLSHSQYQDYCTSFFSILWSTALLSLKGTYQNQTAWWSHDDDRRLFTDCCTSMRGGLIIWILVCELRRFGCSLYSSRSISSGSIYLQVQFMALHSCKDGTIWWLHKTWNSALMWRKYCQIRP